MLSECTGCMLCFGKNNTCSVCRREIADGEEYYNFTDEAVCADCIERAISSPCALCSEDAKGGIVFKGEAYCRECEMSFLEYFGYN